METKKPKVGIFTKPIDQGTSGSGSHLQQLINHVLKINNNFNIVFIHYEKKDKGIYTDNKQLIIPKNPITASIKLKKYDFDIIHYSPLTVFSPILLKEPIKVATIHGAAPYFLPQQYSKIKVWHEKFIRPFYARRMDYIFTVSKTSKEFISEQYKVEKDKIGITYNAVQDDFKMYDERLLNVREKYNIKGPFVFHLSKFSERKNPWTILKSFKILKEANKKIKLVLAGKGWKNKGTVGFITKHGLKDSVIFPGFISRKDIIEFLNTAEVFIFPSFYEGCGMPNLEAMACGCPVITSDAFAIPEIVGEAALLLSAKTDADELANKIRKIMRDDNLRDELINKGLKQVQLYSWEESAKTVLNIYSKLITDKY